MSSSLPSLDRCALHREDCLQLCTPVPRAHSPVFRCVDWGGGGRDVDWDGGGRGPYVSCAAAVFSLSHSVAGAIRVTVEWSRQPKERDTNT